MEYKINKYDSIRHGCTILCNMLNPTKRAKSKNSHYSLILKGSMKTHSRKENFRNFLILLEIGSISMIVMGKMTSKI